MKLWKVGLCLSFSIYAVWRLDTLFGIKPHLHNAIPVPEALVTGLAVGELAREASGTLITADTWDPLLANTVTSPAVALRGFNATPVAVTRWRGAKTEEEECVRYVNWPVPSGVSFTHSLVHIYLCFPFWFMFFMLTSCKPEMLFIQFCHCYFDTSWFILPSTVCVPLPLWIIVFNSAPFKRQELYHHLPKPGKSWYY